MRYIVFIGIVLTALFASWYVKAEGRLTVVGGGIVCDSLKELEQYMVGREAGKPKQALLHSIAGCWQLVRPILAKMEHVKVFQFSKERKAYIVKITSGKKVWYGWYKVVKIEGYSI